MEPPGEQPIAKKPSAIPGSSWNACVTPYANCKVRTQTVTRVSKVGRIQTVTKVSKVGRTQP